MKEIQFHSSIPGREELHLQLKVDDSGQIQEAQLKGIGNSQLLKLLKDYRPKLTGNLNDVPLPEGKETSSMMLRELILKAQGKWDFPFKEEETCHCRVVSTEKVDQAILVGAHTPQQVSEQTSASTACGTCRPDVEAMLDYRLKKHLS